MADGFFKWDDEEMEELSGTVLDRGFWWSRRYEYHFALSLIKPNDIILDAACGTYHPFKYAAGDICKTYACDIDTVPLSDKYEYSYASITNLPYEDKMFSKVFCISVLEHLPQEEIIKALKEFKRVLKSKGKLILTIDHPACNIEWLYDALSEAGFKTGKINTDMANAVVSTYYGREIYCYHIVGRG